MSVYYNENDKQKAAWLRELIKAHVIADGEVDERSITEVQPDDLRGFTQCHFFAGIGVWSYALRLAGWPDDRPVWTGSCPCPSFSCAGKGRGFDDPRHLWPAWFGLIRKCSPATIFGEQADDAIGYGWLDLVQTDLEGAAYSVGKAVLGACSVGAPHIRQRLYFGAHAASSRRQDERQHGSGQSPLSARSEQRSRIELRANAERDGGRSDLARREEKERIADGWDRATSNSSHSNGRLPSHRDLQRSGEQRLLTEDCGTSEHGDTDCGRLAMHGRSSGLSRHTERTGEGESGIGEQSERARLERLPGHERNGRGPGWLDADTARSVAEAGATRGFWANCDRWYGRDGKYRPTQPGIFPLVNGASNRVLKLRGFGDAIVPQVAAEFVKAFTEVREFPGCGS